MERGVKQSNALAQFIVRHEKNRGILIDSIAINNNNYFFKYQDQPIERHCEQMQRIIRGLNVKRCRKIVIDITEFTEQYLIGGKCVFNGTALNSVQQQIDKAVASKTNKEIAAMKRAITYANNKPKRMEERNAKIQKKMEETEKHFQAQRAIRIHELFRRGNQSTQDHSEILGGQASTEVSHRDPVARLEANFNN